MLAILEKIINQLKLCMMKYEVRANHILITVQKMYTGYYGNIQHIKELRNRAINGGLW